MASKRKQSAPASFERHRGNTRGPERSSLKDSFLEAFKSSGTILAAATRLGITRQIVYDWIKDDADFKKNFADAQEDVTELVETAAMARGVNGVERFIISMGKPVVDPVHKCELVEVLDAATKKKTQQGHCPHHWLKYREYSDHILNKLLEGLRPEKYARKPPEVTVNLKIVAEITAEILGIIRRHTPEACPHCKTVLGIAPAIAVEMEKLSKEFEARSAVS